MAKKNTQLFLTNCKKNETPSYLNVFKKDKAYDANGNLLPNHISLHTKWTRKARLLVLTCLSPKTWLDMFLSGSKKKNQK